MCDVSVACAADGDVLHDDRDECCERQNLSKSDVELTDVVDTCDIIIVLYDLLNQAHTELGDTRHAELNRLKIWRRHFRVKSLMTGSINWLHTEASSEATLLLQRREHTASAGVRYCVEEPVGDGHHACGCEEDFRNCKS